MYAGIRSRDGLKVAIKHVAKAKIKEWGQVSSECRIFLVCIKYFSWDDVRRRCVRIVRMFASADRL